MKKRLTAIIALVMMATVVLTGCNASTIHSSHSSPIPKETSTTTNKKEFDLIELENGSSARIKEKDGIYSISFLMKDVLTGDETLNEIAVKYYDKMIEISKENNITFSSMDVSFADENKEPIGVLLNSNLSKNEFVFTDIKNSDVKAFVMDKNPPETPSPAAKETPALDELTNITVGQQNALSKADLYLGVTAFSYEGLIEQLKFEKFSEEEATYAADNCGVDWNEQAAKKAKEYLNVTSFSRDGLIEQLKFEGFTDEQAAYGAKANGF